MPLPLLLPIIDPAPPKNGHENGYRDSFSQVGSSVARNFSAS
jgi:hypothetical protein